MRICRRVLSDRQLSSAFPYKCLLGKLSKVVGGEVTTSRDGVRHTNISSFILS